MINSQNFRGGVEVVERINEEVNRLKLKKNEVLTILSGDVFAGIEAYEEFVKTGMKWFDDEEKLFKKKLGYAYPALVLDFLGIKIEFNSIRAYRIPHGIVSYRTLDYLHS